MEFSLSFQHCNFIIEVMIGTQNLYLQKSTECDMQKVFKQYYNRIDNESSEKIQQYNYVRMIEMIEKCYTMKLLAATIILYNIYNQTMNVLCRIYV